MDHIGSVEFNGSEFCFRGTLDPPKEQTLHLLPGVIHIRSAGIRRPWHVAEDPLISIACPVDVCVHRPGTDRHLF